MFQFILFILPFFSRFPPFCIFCQPRKTNKNIEDLWAADVARESLGSQMFGPTAGWGLEGLDRGVWSFGRFWRCHARETSSTRAPCRGKGGVGKVQVFDGFCMFLYSFNSVFFVILQNPVESALVNQPSAIQRSFSFWPMRTQDSTVGHCLEGIADIVY